MQTHADKTPVNTSNAIANILPASQAVVQGKTAQRVPVIQREPLTVSVSGVTHLVKMEGGSIMEGAEQIEVHEGEVLEIDTETKYRSRRGPNQEVYKDTDQKGEANYRWFLVTKINSVKAMGNLFIRDGTFNTRSPEALGSRGAKISPSQRDRILPEQLTEHEIAANILAAAESAPGRNEIDTVVTQFKSANKTAHDPSDTTRFMRICYALSKDATVNRLIRTGIKQDLTTVKKTVEILAGVSRQILQEWGNPIEDIAQRVEAWIAFGDGVEMLKGDKGKLSRYCNACLVHDKGYAQTHASATEYLLYTAEESSGEVESFEVILKRALNDNFNENIWVGGQKGSDKIEVQLGRAAEKDYALMKTMAHEIQERNMWSRLLAPIMDARFGVREKDWTYVQTILANKGVLYSTVRALVPGSFELHKDYIDDAFSF